jgi:hypothetical protein
MEKRVASKVAFDAEFPPNKDSLVGKRELSAELQKWAGYKWISPKPFYERVPFSVSTSITPMNVTVGDAYKSPLLAPLVALAQIPIRVQGLLQKGGNNDVSFEIKLYANGVPHVVKVDHFFPYDPTARRFVFLNSDVREIWPMIIEKAYAKTAGSYQALYADRGEDSVRNAFAVLTGYPTYAMKHKGRSRENAWKMLQRAMSKQLPSVACAALQPESSLNCDLQCVVVRLVDKVEKNALRHLVHVRAWDQELISQTEVFQPVAGEGISPGLYELDIDQYLRLFHTTVICKFKEDYIYISSSKLGKVEDDDSQSVLSATSSPTLASASALMDGAALHLVSIEAPNSLHAFITLHNQSTNGAKKRCAMVLGYQLANSQQLEFRDSLPYRVQTDPHIELAGLKKGLYYCLIEREADPANPPLTITIRSSTEGIAVKQIFNRSEFKNILIGLIKAYAVMKGTVTEIDKGITEYHFTDCLSIWLGKYFVNGTEDSTLVTMFTVQSGKACFVPPHKGDRAIVRVEPKNAEWLLIQRSDVDMPVLNYRRFVERPKERVLQDIKTGTIQPAEQQEIAPGIFFVHYKLGSGLVFGIRNTTKHMLYKGVHKFALTNVTLDSQGPDNEIQSVLSPESAVYRWAYIEDMFKKPVFTVTHEGNLQTYTQGSATLVKEMMKTGMMTKIGASGAIWTKMIEDHWCMYIKNASKKDMHVIIDVKKAVNLKCSEGEKWDFHIKTGQSYIKRVQSRNPFNVSNCTWHAVCNLE